MEGLPNKNKLMRQIMELDFAVNELVLFLDTHPDNQNALRRHEELAKRAREAKAKYEDAYGPLTPSAPIAGNYWTWIDNPWPWDNQ